MTCLTIIQDVAQRVNLPSPTSAAQSADPQVIQLVALANKEGEWLSNKDWQVLTKETSFVTTAVQLQTTLSVTAPGLKNIINDTIWNRDLRRPVYGPMTAQRYQQVQAAVFAGPWNQFIIQGDQILFFPVPAAGQTCWFQYTTQNWCESSGGTGQARFVMDSDVLLLREDLFKLGVEWRWKKAKGLEYAQEFADYEDFMANALARDGTKDIINMGSARYDIFPGILVPSGSWPI
jgi:hypothetical protein